MADNDMRGLKGHMAAFLQGELAQDGAIASMMMVRKRPESPQDFGQAPLPALAARQGVGRLRPRAMGWPKRGRRQRGEN